MPVIGIMGEIKELLSQGKSSSEVIALGHKPPTVYKVQRQLRKQGGGEGAALTPGRDIIGVAARSQPEAEISPLQQQIAALQTELVDTDSLRSQLEQAQARIEELEAEAESVATLAETVGSLLQEARSWQSKAAETQNALNDAQRHQAEAREVIQSLTPLTVWAGHSCCVCGEPTDGALNRELAAKLLELVGHRVCLHGAGLKKITFRSLSLSANSTVLADEPRELRIAY